MSGHASISDPVAALAELAGEVAGFEDLVGVALLKLDLLEVVEGPQVSGWMAAYERGLDRTARILRDMARLDIGRDRLLIAAVVVNALTGGEAVDAERQPVRHELARVAEGVQAGLVDRRGRR